MIVAKTLSLECWNIVFQNDYLNVLMANNCKKAPLQLCTAIEAYIELVRNIKYPQQIWSLWLGQ